MYRTLVMLSLSVGAVLATACSSSGAGGRPIDVTQRDDGCTPASIEATPGEKLNLKVKNETGGIYEIEGIEGTELEEVVVPEGRTREVGFNVPADGGVSKIKCYVPGGASTIIEVHGGDLAATSATPGGEATRDAGGAADTTVSVTLSEWEVSPNLARVEAGSIRFEATNESADQVHELAVLRRKDDGSIAEVLGEIEDLDPGASGSIVIEMEAGQYELACVIVPGEAGSTVDHYQQGMRTDFEVR
jgi:uncharacterized cupredoxin-like copper-binding protein